jgi:hypothetical protein
MLAAARLGDDASPDLSTPARRFFPSHAGFVLIGRLALKTNAAFQ